MKGGCRSFVDIRITCVQCIVREIVLIIGIGMDIVGALHVFIQQPMDDAFVLLQVRTCVRN
jgi:hypothetical protein